MKVTDDTIRSAKRLFSRYGLVAALNALSIAALERADELDDGSDRSASLFRALAGEFTWLSKQSIRQIEQWS